GPEVIKELGPPLSLLLTSARWLTHRVGEECREVFAGLYRQLASEAGSPVISATDYWARVQGADIGEEGPIIGSLLTTLRQKWADILSISGEERRVSYRSEELRGRVMEAFDAPRPGWPEARYHSPDLMIAASSADEIRRGNYEIVLGEIHVARNTLSYSVFLEQHPNVDELFRAVELDMPRPRLLPVTPKYMTGLTSRVYLRLMSSKDYTLEFSRDAAASDGSRSLAIGEMVVEENSEGLIVRTRDGRVQLDIIDAFGDVLTGQVINSFKVLAPGDHTPRINLDRVVIHRETWRFPVSEMDFAFEKDEAYRFLEARRWAGAHSLPRFIFVKVPVEIKPLFVDLDSPVLVNLFAKMVRQAGEKDSPDAVITVTEMLPGPDQVWLPDGEGNRYTSELRVIAVDLKD
ncbi:MAG TPA: lantibiotic dehydratase, partial [Blastocatellia bacterium]|nr:lantibiotic dehydratase [Blastocatellia bacterium]